MAKISRRAALIGLGAAGAALAPSQAGKALAGTSVQFQAYLAARNAVEACGAEDSAGWCDAEYEAHEERMDLLLDRSNAAARLVVERTPANWDEVSEAAQVVFRELFDGETWEKHSSCPELEAGLFRAIFAMKPLETPAPHL